MVKKIAVVVGARPNFMKAAPLMRQLTAHPGFEPILIHTGQHYDHKMSQLFFEELKMPKPDHYLGVGSGSHSEQTAKIMIEVEKRFVADRPDLCVVFGDVNSTMAASIVAAKLHLPVAHVEAGLRSYDNFMPEEINRIVTDRISDYLFVSEPSGLKNLKKEGADDSRIFFTGNIMIDTLRHNLEASKKSTILQKMKLNARGYAVMTLHRPSNVDDQATLRPLLEVVSEIGQKTPVVFPCHPRTAKGLEANGLISSLDPKALRIIEPLGYLDFLSLQSQAKFVLTDSGGIQEETTFLQIPCITLRENTERPVTVDEGTNELTGPDPAKIRDAAARIYSGNWKKGSIPEFWDGATAQRIVAKLDELLLKKAKVSR